MNWKGTEKRRFVRVEYPCQITIRYENNIITTYSENISEGGIRAILEEKLETHSFVNLEISGVKKEAIFCKGEVRWVTERETPGRAPLSFYDTGIQFHNIKEEDIQAIKNLVSSIISNQNPPNQET